jgi:DNA-binding IclR family transcriptional regulator
VLLAWGALDLPEGELEQLTPATLSDADAVRRDGRRARDRGWSLTEDELEIGLTGIAVPVFGLRGDVVASLGISGPTPRLAERVDELGRHLLDQSTALSTLLRGPAHTDPAHRAARTQEVVA